jgi:hypothetical protein
VRHANHHLVAALYNTILLWRVGHRQLLAHSTLDTVLDELTTAVRVKWSQPVSCLCFSGLLEQLDGAYHLILATQAAHPHESATVVDEVEVPTFARRHRRYRLAKVPMNQFHGFLCTVLCLMRKCRVTLLHSEATTANLICLLQLRQTSNHILLNQLA